MQLKRRKKMENKRNRTIKIKTTKDIVKILEGLSDIFKITKEELSESLLIHKLYEIKEMAMNEFDKADAGDFKVEQ